MWGILYGELIIDGVYEYSYVVSKRPQDKEAIDNYLRSNGKSDLIVVD